MITKELFEKLLYNSLEEVYWDDVVEIDPVLGEDDFTAAYEEARKKCVKDIVTDDFIAYLNDKMDKILTFGLSIDKYDYENIVKNMISNLPNDFSSEIKKDSFLFEEKAVNIGYFDNRSSGFELGVSYNIIDACYLTESGKIVWTKELYWDFGDDIHLSIRTCSNDNYRMMLNNCNKYIPEEYQMIWEY